MQSKNGRNNGFDNVRNLFPGRRSFCKGKL